MREECVFDGAHVKIKLFLLLICFFDIFQLCPYIQEDMGKNQPLKSFIVFNLKCSTDTNALMITKANNHEILGI